MRRRLAFLFLFCAFSASSDDDTIIANVFPYTEIVPKAIAEDTHRSELARFFSLRFDFVSRSHEGDTKRRRVLRVLGVER